MTSPTQAPSKARRWTAYEIQMSSMSANANFVEASALEAAERELEISQEHILKLELIIRSFAERVDKEETLRVEIAELRKSFESEVDSNLELCLAVQRISKENDALRAEVERLKDESKRADVTNDTLGDQNEMLKSKLQVAVELIEKNLCNHARGAKFVSCPGCIALDQLREGK